MEFWSTIAGLMRRPVVVIPTVLVAVTLGALAYLGTPKVYVSSTTMVLTPTTYGGTLSQDPTKPNDLTNPLLNFNTSLQTTSAILIQAMSTKDVLDDLGAATGGTQLIINDGRTNPDLLGLNGPFLYIEARSLSAQEAHDTVVAAQKVMKEKLTELQNAVHAPEQTYVSIEDVVSPTAPKATNARAVKLGLMAFIFGFVLCVGIAYFGHQVRARRRARAAVVPIVVDTTPPPHEGPTGSRSRRRSHSPIVEAVSDEEDPSDADIEDVPASREHPAEPAVAAPRKRKADSGFVPIPLQQPESTVLPTPVKQPEPTVLPTPTNGADRAVVPAPVKLKVRYRNR
jgi:hypothetical protein